MAKIQRLGNSVLDEVDFFLYDSHGSSGARLWFAFGMTNSLMPKKDLFDVPTSLLPHRFSFYSV